MKPKPIDILNEIRMHRAVRPHQSILLLEGRTDCSYYRNVVCRQGCRIIPAKGKVIARQAARLATENGVPGVAAVLDRDHDAFLGRVSDNPNVIYTDENDFEITAIRSPGFERYLNEFLDHEDRVRILNDSSCDTIAEFVLTTVGPIGILRFLNSRETWELKCRDIDVGQVFSRDSMSVDCVRLVDHLFEISANPNTSVSVVRQALEGMLTAETDHAQYAVGHDATKLIAYLLSNRMWLNTDLELCSYQVEQGLRLTLSDDLFRNTGMFRRIQEWETGNSPFHLLPRG